MNDDELLLIPGRRPETADQRVGVVMLKVSGLGNENTQWFAYRPAFNLPIVRVEWDVDTMNVVLPPSVSDYLVRNGYARLMNDSEAKAYNALLPETDGGVNATEPSEGNQS